MKSIIKWMINSFLPEYQLINKDVIHSMSVQKYYNAVTFYQHEHEIINDIKAELVGALLLSDMIEVIKEEETEFVDCGMYNIKVKIKVKTTNISALR